MIMVRMTLIKGHKYLIEVIYKLNSWYISKNFLILFAIGINLDEERNYLEEILQYAKEKSSSILDFKSLGKY